MFNRISVRKQVAETIARFPWPRLVGTRGARVKSSQYVGGFPSVEGACIFIGRKGNETRRGEAYPVASGTVNRGGDGDGGAHATKGFRAPAEPRDTFNSRLREISYFFADDIRAVAASSCEPRRICLGARTALRVLHVDGATAPQHATTRPTTL